MNQTSSILYANGNFGKSSLLSIFEIYGLFFITDVLGVDPAKAGFVILVSLLWDAFTDPILGFIGDKYQRTAGTLVFFGAIGAPITLAAFLCLFFSPHFGIENGWAVLGILLLFRTGYTIIDVPHNSLFVRLANNSNQSAKLAAFRLFFSALGRVSVTTLASFLIVTEEPIRTESGFETLAIAVSCIFLISFGLCVHAVRDVKLHETDHSNGNQFETLVVALKAPAVFKVFVLTAINSFTLPLIMSSLVYIGKYHEDSHNSGMLLVNILACAQIASLILWAQSFKWRWLKFSPALLAYLLLGFAIVVGLVLINKIFVAYIFCILVGVAASGISLTNWSMLPQALSTASSESDKNNLSVFALYTLINKIFNGLSQGFLGLILAFANYDASTATFATISQIHPLIFLSSLCLVSAAIFVVIRFSKNIASQ